MRIMMLVSSAVAYFLNAAIAKGKYANAGRDEFRVAPYLPGLDYVAGFDRSDLLDLVPDNSEAGRRQYAVVEAGDDHFLRNAGRRGDSGTGEGIHLDRIAARAKKS